MPKVSVILTSFNHEKYICEAIESVLHQTFTDFELIIWDDASSDNSWHLINNYSDLRIKTYLNDERSGPVFGINKAISEVASGEYIAIHHSDDVWEPDKLEKQVAFLDGHDDVGAVFTNAIIISEDGSLFADKTHFYSNIFDQPNRTKYGWLNFFFNSGNALCHPSILIRKTCSKDCGPYTPGLAQLCDFDMWIRLCLKYEIHVIPEKLTKFRVRDNEANASGDRPDTRIRTAYEMYKILQNYRNLTKFEDLVKTFPSSAEYYRNDETDVGFALGMIALQEPALSITSLFGQDLLFEAISDPERAKNLKRLYDFDEISFIILAGNHDVFARHALSEAQRLAFERLDEVEALTARLELTDRALSEAQHLAIRRLGDIEALTTRSELTDRALSEAQHLAIRRLGDIEALTTRLEATDRALNEAQYLAIERLGEIEALTTRLEAITQNGIWKFLKSVGLLKEHS